MSSRWAWSVSWRLHEFTVEHDGFTYTKDHPIVWIGGFSRSGTTLMRVLMEMSGNIKNPNVDLKWKVVQDEYIQ